MPHTPQFGDIPFGNYTYPYDTLLASSDSLQHAEAMRMLRDVYIVDVESSQGANQFILFCQRAWHEWLPSLFSADCLAFKCLIVVAVVVCAAMLLSGCPARVRGWRHQLTCAIAVLLLLLAALPLGASYFVPMGLTFVSVGLVVLLAYGLFRSPWSGIGTLLKPLLLLVVGGLALLDFSTPIPTLDEVQRGDNPVDTFFVVVCSAVLLPVVLSLVEALMLWFRNRRPRPYFERRRLARHQLLCWALFSWSLAFLLYFIGIYYSGTQRSALTALLRPALSASKVFLLADNLGEVTLAFRRSGLFMGLMSLARLVAFLVSARIVIRMLGARLTSSLRMRLAHCTGSPLYVFWGLDPVSLQVARTIEQPEGARPLVVFVDVADDELVQSRTTFGFGSFVSMLTHKRESLEAVREVSRPELPALLTVASARLEDLPSDGPTFRQVGLKNLERLIGESSRVEFFFLSSEERACISGAQRLSDMLSAGMRSRSTIYCRSRQSGIAQLMQFGDVRIEVVDYARLAIDQLQHDPSGLLTDLATFDSEGRCTSTLQSLVVGMDEVGLEAVRYLYTYGAFVGADRRRSPFVCHVTDAHADRLAGDFYRLMPALRPDAARREGDARVELMTMAAGSDAFWQWVEEHVLDLQAIVVAQPEGDGGVELADRLYRLAVRRRAVVAPALPLRIYVCAYTASGADRLTLMQAAYRRHATPGGVELVPFGRPGRLFTYAGVSRSVERQQAQRFYQAYQDATVQLYGITTPLNWNTRRAKAQAEGTLAPILEYLRMEAQDVGNACHARTKLAILASALAQAPQRPDGGTYTLSDLEPIWSRPLTPNTDLASLTPDGYLAQLVESLAIVEHLRWEASHEVMGFVQDPAVPRELRSLLGRHTCLMDWDELSDDIRRSDYAVVFTTLSIDHDDR